MKLAIVTLTKGAAGLGRQLQKKIGGILYCKEPFVSNEDEQTVEMPFSEFAGKLFSKYEGIIFIMATGIVVRSLAPYIVAKTSDPAIVVMDEGGRHAISLLSGHLGGGNALALSVANAVGGEPVITTASDVTGTLAVDMLAKSIGGVLTDMEAAKNVTALSVNGGNVTVLSTCDLPEHVVMKLPKRTAYLRLSQSELGALKTEKSWDYEADGVVVITPDQVALPENAVQIIPRNLTVGIGCRKDVAPEIVDTVFDKACRTAGICRQAIKHIATIELKSRERGIQALCAHLNVPLKIITLSEIEKVENHFKGSDFVQKTIGVRAVAEPCAMLSAGEGHMRMKRYADQGVTIAIWEENNAI